MEKKKLVEGEMHEQIYSKLVEMADFDLPEDMIAYQSNERLHRYQMELISKGAPLGEVEKNIDDLKNASKESVVKDFKLSLVIERIAEKEKIFVTEDDVNQRISGLAGMYGIEPALMRKHLEKINSMSSLRHQLKAHKTLNFLMNEAMIEEVKEEMKEKG